MRYCRRIENSPRVSGSYNRYSSTHCSVILRPVDVNMNHIPLQIKTSRSLQSSVIWRRLRISDQDFPVSFTITAIYAQSWHNLLSSIVEGVVNALVTIKLSVN
jgi:hypothetical protein